MPVNCSECGEEKGYSEVKVIWCNLEHEHCYCVKCRRKIKKENNDFYREHFL